MEPDPRLPRNNKSNQCPITNQINKYRNSLPEVQRSQNHFFFKQIHHQQQVIYSTIGYSVGRIPFQLMDLFAVVINDIHCYTECNLKIIMDGDQLWVTSTIGTTTSQIDSADYNIQQANLNQSLRKTQRLIAQFLQTRKRQSRTQDKKILQQVKEKLCKSINLVFKNPNLDD